MKRTCTTFAVLSVLASMFIFFASGTASAQAVQTVSASKISVASSCSYTKESQWTWDNGHGAVTIIKWKNNCNGEYHCEAQDVSYSGNFWIYLTYESSVVEAGASPFLRGSILNTPDAPAGALSYTCSGHTAV